ncbi:ComF family protein [Bacillus sp. FJAT-42376]|uniref:ComF family protein n=1 Tax=Bacillus sp. FJAT-42376 TaxID=2014076 RepID=UPI000F5097EB|nr:ComF family protein [Bacillus sp. FJAT-42376]AZB44543.1 ComF family protein [Bacillus sp. FJAT-42376]
MSWCILCHSKMLEQVTWGMLLGTDPDPVACGPCSEKLSKIAGPVCTKCGRPMESEALCRDCVRWEENGEYKGLFTRNRSIYSYTDSVKEIMNLFKFRGDAELIRLFEQDIREASKKISRKAILVPIPLSEERLMERGFNQAELISAKIRRPILHPLIRLTSEKQSKKSRKERLLGVPLFATNPEVDIQGCDIVIVDDIYTTGNTVYQAAKLLKEAGAAEISSLTLIRG